MIKRYSFSEMSEIWSLENKFQKWLEIEIAACEAMNKLNLIPDDDLQNIKSKAKFRLNEIEEIEKKVNHDVIAFLTNVAQYVGTSSRFIHLGLTSSDIIDTANSCLMKRAGNLILNEMKNLSEILKQKAYKYKNLLCIGRSHGIHAEPMTFGLKFALWFDEMQRNIKRMKSAIENISVGQISGAVGNYVHIEPFIEKYVCKKMGLKSVNISNQIIQRDRYAQYISTLAIVGSTIEKIALEIRGLQRTEIHEVEEGFTKNQKGSSAMPHKKNPILSEQLCGLARILRSNSLTAFENNALWHERDISHSSTERIIIPDSTILIHYMLLKASKLVKNLKVIPEEMKRNMELTNGLIFSQTILLELTKKNVTRETAYKIVQRCAMKCWNENMSFEKVLSEDKELLKIINFDELKKMFNFDKFTKNINFIFKRVFADK
ncbi:MAG: adenylosuccinate lyase [Candidatus Cloacimonetes bacterium]|nr:adenylosuccinate lyase [Candidatus Cloacimonadota bacterium]MBL7107678.1 adenylosuccinate lyase [Candidatus Cloacimonadota bacterium]